MLKTFVFEVFKGRTAFGENKKGAVHIIDVHLQLAAGLELNGQAVLSVPRASRSFC